MCLQGNMLSKYRLVKWEMKISLHCIFTAASLIRSGGSYIGMTNNIGVTWRRYFKWVVKNANGRTPQLKYVETVMMYG